jgi:hypothetical protein
MAHPTHQLDPSPDSHQSNSNIHTVRLVSPVCGRGNDRYLRLHIPNEHPKPLLRSARVRPAGCHVLGERAQRDRLAGPQSGLVRRLPLI